MVTKHKIVVLEGLPAAGKTSVLDLCSRVGYTVIPEIVLPELEGVVEVDDESRFVKNDLAKLSRARNSTAEIVIVDRGLLSTLAHNFAIGRQTGKWDEYNRVLDAFNKAKSEGFRPDYYIFLDIDTEVSLKRKERNSDDANPWANREGLSLIQEFYRTAFVELEPEVKLFRVDANLGLSAVGETVLGILAKMNNKDMNNWQDLVGLVQQAFDNSWEKAGGQGFRYFHSLNVAEIARRICMGLKLDEASTRLVMVAALFHDIGKAERVREDGFLDGSHATEQTNNLRSHEDLSAEYVRTKLLDYLSNQEAEQVAGIILGHKEPQGDLGKVLHDADELSEMGVMNVWKMTTYSAEKKRDMLATIDYWFDEDRGRHEEKMGKLYFDISKEMARARIALADIYFSDLKKELGGD